MPIGDKRMQKASLVERKQIENVKCVKHMKSVTLMEVLNVQCLYSG